MLTRILPLTGLLAGLLSAAPDGSILYGTYCSLCHDAPNQDRLPKRDQMAKRTPENLLEVMTTGSMKEQAKRLSADEKAAIALFLTGKMPTVAGSVVEPPAGLCEGERKPFNPAPADIKWNGWGNDDMNSRYQPNPGLKADDVPKLKLKWAFGFPGAALGYSQPTIAGGRLFLGSATTKVYSLDAKTGCTYWASDVGAWVRTAPVLVKIENKWALLIGDEKAQALALDANTGDVLWKTKIDDHNLARVVGALKVHGGKAYVAASSWEEGAGQNAKYECCKFRGSVSALDLKTGKVMWKSYSISDPPKPFKKNDQGTQMYGPAGGAIWSSPTIDAKRGVLYVATGNSYTDVETRGNDAIMAMDLATGSIKWINQITPKDSFLVGCRQPGKGNCPEDVGPDVDFGTSPILRDLPGGKSVLLCGQKSGVLYALDPDKRGEKVWETRVGKGSELGGIEWGPAADSKNVYVAVSDSLVRPPNRPGGIWALNIANGEKVWMTPAPKADCTFKAMAPCNPGQPAAVTVMPGVVFSGSLDGHLRAFSATDGAIVWDFNTGVPFETVNKVKASGGSIDGAGVTIADGMVFTNSGYGRFMGGAGNVLLAFSVDGK
jgi:polyvinyl alcohol dehydrogenase (cytochrome)